MALLTLQPGEIAFAGYKFPRAFIVQDLGLENQIDGMDIAFAPGQYMPNGKPGPKTITVSGTMGGGGANVDQNGKQIITLDDLQAEMDRLMTACFSGIQPLQWRYDRYTYAQAQRPKVSYAPAGGYHTAAVQIDFTCGDPRSYGNTAHSLNVQSTTTGGSASGSFANGGNARAYPTITLTFQAACVNPQIVVTPGGQSGTITLSLSGTFQTTDTIVITCDPRTRALTKNGTSTWSILTLPIANTADTNEIMPFFNAGAGNVVAVSASSGQVTAQVSYSDTYLD